jgi:hypothetical protein
MGTRCLLRRVLLENIPGPEQSRGRHTEHVFHVR